MFKDKIKYKNNSTSNFLINPTKLTSPFAVSGRSGGKTSRGYTGQKRYKNSHVCSANSCIWGKKVNSVEE